MSVSSIFSGPIIATTVAMMLSAFSVEASTGGAVIIDASAPTLAQRGWEYRTPLNLQALEQVHGQLGELTWQYDFTPAADMPRAWLCASSNCLPLPIARGSTLAFTGLPAGTPLEFRFVLPGKGMLKRPVRGGDLQLIINYRYSDH